MQKLRDLWHFISKPRSEANDIYNIRYPIPWKIVFVLHNGPNYDFYLSIKNLANKFD